MNRRDWFQRSAVKTKPAVGPRPIYPVHRADFLTMLLENGEPEFIALEQYQQMPAERRARCRAAHVKAGMTRYCVGVCFDGGDHIADPEPFLPILQELYAEGLGPMIFACPEDSPSMKKKYENIDYYCQTLRSAMDVWNQWVTEIWFGVEADEVWPAWKWLKAAEAVKPYGKPVVLHLLSGNVLPRDISNPDWWAQAKASGITHLAYQANHPAVEDAGGAFLADPRLIRQELKDAVTAVRGHVQVVSSEYAYYGKYPSQKTIDYVSRIGYQLGEKSLEEPGIVGIGNGGPGYWPPEQPKPGTGVDDIDVNTVRFYSTHPYSDITDLMRSWPAESKLTPEFFDNGRKVRFAHTYAASWPDYEGGNANTWMVVSRLGKWEAYTTDYLRPGHGKNTEKIWFEINHWVREPITYGPPASGEIIYLMVSRLDPRLAKYPVGAGRSNLVRMVAP